MAVPKRKTSHSRTNSRKAHWKASIEMPTLVECPQCHERTRPHHVCPTCGTYGGKEIIAT